MDSHTSILIVDDEPKNFEVIETFLDSENHILNYASSGVKALQRLDAIQPDLILLDVMMPELDGMEVSRRIKANPQWQSIPIIMVTALTSKQDLAACLEAGADDFISKPINSIELRARVRSMLRIKHHYDQVQSLLFKQQELIQMREDMANMIVHDLQNPVAAILLASELLKNPNITAEKREKKVDQITNTTQRLRSLINNLLLMAKFESGKMTLNQKAVDIEQICCTTLMDFEAIASQKNIRFICSFPPQSTLINVDSDLFRRVLDNLLSNAVKFSPPETEIILKVEILDSQKVQLQVIDVGLGVKEELREIIFKKYEVGTLMKNVPQTGLGLAFCKMVIEAHGGKISVENHQPQGSIFTIELELNRDLCSTPSLPGDL